MDALNKTTIPQSNPATGAKTLLKWYLENGIDEILAETAEPKWHVSLKPSKPTSAAASPVTVASPAAEDSVGPTKVPVPSFAAGSPPQAAPVLPAPVAEKKAQAIDFSAMDKGAFLVAIKEITDLQVTAHVPESTDVLWVVPNVPAKSAEADLLAKMTAAIKAPLNNQAHVMINASKGMLMRLTQPQSAVVEKIVGKMVALSSPKMVVFVGDFVARHILDAKINVRQLREIPTLPYGDVQLPSGFIFHPQFLLRTPAQKKQAWEDLQNIEARMKETSA